MFVGYFSEVRMGGIVGLNSDCRVCVWIATTRRLFYFALDRGGKEGYFIFL
jgi:hypothetical protein